MSFAETKQNNILDFDTLYDLMVVSPDAPDLAARPLGDPPANHQKTMDNIDAEIAHILDSENIADNIASVDIVGTGGKTNKQPTSPGSPSDELTYLLGRESVDSCGNDLFGEIALPPLTWMDVADEEEVVTCDTRRWLEIVKIAKEKLPPSECRALQTHRRKIRDRRHASKKRLQQQATEMMMKDELARMHAEMMALRSENTRLRSMVSHLCKSNVFSVDASGVDTEVLVRDRKPTP